MSPTPTHEPRQGGGRINARIRWRFTTTPRSMRLWRPSPPSQHAVFELAQLCGLGVSARVRTSAGRQGTAPHPPRRLLAGPPRPAARARAIGWPPSSPPGRALCSHTAQPRRCTNSEHPRPRGSTSRSPAAAVRTAPGIQIHRSTTLTEADITTVNGIPSTTVARTLFDLADVIPRRALTSGRSIRPRSSTTRPQRDQRPA